MDFLVPLVPPFHENLATGRQDVSIHSLLFKYFCSYHLIFRFFLSPATTLSICSTPFLSILCNLERAKANKILNNNVAREVIFSYET